MRAFWLGLISPFALALILALAACAPISLGNFPLGRPVCVN